MSSFTDGKDILHLRELVKIQDPKAGNPPFTGGIENTAQGHIQVN